MTRPEHPSGSDRIHEAHAKLDPDGKAEIVVNLQGDFPTITIDNIREVLPPLQTLPWISQRWPRDPYRGGKLSIRRREGDRLASAQRLRALYLPAPPRPPATGRVTTISASTPIAAPRWSVSSLCRPRRWNSRRSSSSSGRWKPDADRLHHRRYRAPRGRYAGRPGNRPPHPWQILSADTRPSHEQKLKIAFQGEPGANSHIAIVEAYPDAEPLPCATFEDALAAISSGEADLGMIPIENSVAGRVADIHHLLPASGLFIVGEWFLPIRHQLMAVRGAKLADIKTVESHVHALGQCRRIIRKLGIKPIVAADTAGSARDVSERNDKTSPRSPRGWPRESTASISWPRTSRTRPTTPRASWCWRANRNGPRRARGRWSRLLFSGCAICPPRSTRRSAALPPTAST